MFVVGAGAAVEDFGVDFVADLAAGLFVGAAAAGAAVVAGFPAGAALGSGTGAGAVCAWPTDVSDALATRASVSERKYMIPPDATQLNATRRNDDYAMPSNPLRNCWLSSG